MRVGLSNLLLHLKLDLIALPSCGFGYSSWTYCGESGAFSIVYYNMAWSKRRETNMAFMNIVAK